METWNLNEVHNVNSYANLDLQCMSRRIEEIR